MNRKFFNVYQYIAFLIVFPLTIFMWYKVWNNKLFVILTMSLPVITAYIIPAIGTNVTKLWEFNTKFMIGKFRIYHGFVLGSVTSLFALMFNCISPVYDGILNSLYFALIFATFIAFWNYFYDVYAVKCGFIKLNNKLAYEKQSPYEIVADYAPVYFFALGFIYAIYLKLLQYYFAIHSLNVYLIISFHLIALILPTTIFACISYKTHGYWGISKYEPIKEKIKK